MKQKIIIFALAAVAGYIAAGTLAQYPPFSNAYLAGMNFAK
jgi:hypothetical protein